MTVTQPQQQLIQQHLRSILKFKDTYEELYDHILTALEDAPEDMTYEEAIENIINDLGGTRGIKAVESRFKTIAVRDFFNSYLRYAARCLSSPIAVLIIVATWLFYFCAKEKIFGSISPFIVAWQMGLIPIIILLFKRIKSGRPTAAHDNSFVDTKSYIRSVNVGWFSAFPVVMLLQVVQWLNVKLMHEVSWGLLPPTILFFIAIVHSLSFYNLYKDHFKTKMES